jgi:hypothetical protein
MAESGGVSRILGAESEASVEGSVPETALDPTAAAFAGEARRHSLGQLPDPYIAETDRC